MNGSLGLTNLKDDTILNNSPASMSPIEADNRKLFEVQGEVQTLTKIRDSLKEEVKRLNYVAEKTQEDNKSNTENKKLRREKELLLKQIKDLKGLKFVLQVNADKLSTALDEFSGERMEVIGEISNALSLDLEKTSEMLSQKSNQLELEEELIADMAEYFQSLAEIALSQSQQNDARGQELSKMSKDTKKDRELARSLVKQAQNNIKKADKILKAANKEKKEANETVKAIEEKAKKILEKSESVQTALKRYDQELKAKARELREKEEEQRLIDIKQKDERQTLERIRDEFEAKGMI